MKEIIVVSGMIGFLVLLATGCSDAYEPIVYKTAVLTLLTAKYVPVSLK